MTINADYLTHTILAMYGEPTNTGQIHSVIVGRSTPSTFYLVEKNQWFKYYALMPKLKRQVIDKLHQSFLKQGFIQPATKHFELTEAGQEQVETYFENHYQIQSINYFQTVYFRRAYFEMISFMTQVISEKCYDNHNYIPLKQDLSSQLAIKAWFKTVTSIEQKWPKEQSEILQQLDKNQALALANLLSGHQLTGLTNHQIAQELSMSASEFYMLKNDAIFNYLEAAKQGNYPLHQKLYKFIYQLQHEDLTPSAYESYQLLKQGYPIHAVAAAKRVKEGTIKEHILEIAFKLPELPIVEIVPESIAKQLRHYFKHKTDYSHKEAAEIIEDLEFYHYRLVELELMRHG